MRAEIPIGEGRSNEPPPIRIDVMPVMLGLRELMREKKTYYNTAIPAIGRANFGR